MTLIRTLFLTASFTLALSTTALSDDTQAVREKLVSAHETFTDINDFMRTYGVEISRELNMRQRGELKGQISGSLEGSGRMLHIGNVHALTKGVVGLGDAGLAAVSSFYPVPAGLVGNALSDVLRGLSGWGYGSMGISGSLSGEIEGSFQGEGYQIHSQPNLFLVLVKNTASLEPHRERLERAVEERWIGYEAAEAVLGIMDSPYIVSLEDAQKFMADRDELRGRLDAIATDLIAAAGDDRTVLQDVDKYVERMRDWLVHKRVVFAVIAPNPEDFAVRETVWNTYELAPITPPAAEFLVKKGETYKLEGSTIERTRWYLEGTLGEFLSGKTIRTVAGAAEAQRNIQTELKMQLQTFMPSGSFWHGEEEISPERVIRPVLIRAESELGITIDNAPVKGVDVLTSPEHLSIREVRLLF